MTRPYPVGEPDDGHGRGEPIVLDERYELLELLGRGGMAEVHRARDRQLGRLVAVKVLPADRRDDHTDTRRLRDEARAVAGLSHPHVIAVYDVGSSPQGVYVVMELLGGRTWRDELRERAPLPEVEVARVGAAIAAALGAAHAQGIVHRDVNPANVMILDDGTPKLMDFGIARAQDLGGHTDTGAIIGTPAYMSPEQARGEHLDGRSDIYSLGCALYEAVTGRAPFTGHGSAEVASMRLREPPIPPRQHRPAISVGFEDLVLRAMALAPWARPDAAMLATVLRDLAAGEPAGNTETLPVDHRAAAEPIGDADTPPAPEAPPAVARLRRAGLVLVALGMLALVALGVLLVLGVL